MPTRPRRISPLAVVFLTIFLDLLGFGLIIPALPYYAITLHASEEQVAMLGTVYSLMQLLFVPLWGRLSDRVGRRPVLLVSVFGSILGMTILGAANALWMLFAARVVSGIMTANFATAQAYVADITVPERRARAMGIVGAALGLGFVVGPPVGGALASFGRSIGVGYGIIGYFAAGLSALNFLFALAALPESLRPEDRERAIATRSSRIEGLRLVLRSASLYTLVLVQFVGTGAFSAMEWTLALFTRARLGWDEAHSGERLNGFFLGYVGVVIAIVQGGLVGRLTRRYGEGRLLVAGTLLAALGMAAVAMSEALPMLLLAGLLLAVGNGLVMPCLSSLVSRRSPSDAQGAVLGVHQAAGAAARVLGPAIGGVLFQRVSITSPYVGSAGGLLVATALAVIALRAGDPTPA